MLSYTHKQKGGALQRKPQPRPALKSRQIRGEDERSLGRSLGNRSVGRMMAQRMPLAPRIQRDPPPAPDPCPDGVRQIDIFAVNLPGSTRTIYDDQTKTNAVLAQCCARINITGGESWDTNLMDTDAPHGVLNHSTATATTEVQDMTAHRPGGNVLHAYYVPSISIGSRGSSFYASRYGGAFPSTANAIQVANSAADDTMVHELVHVLLDDGGHHADPDNLMASGGTRNVGVDNMDAAQCAGI